MSLAVAQAEEVDAGRFWSSLVVAEHGGDPKKAPFPSSFSLPTPGSDPLYRTEES